jgi:hypothetical protein
LVIVRVAFVSDWSAATLSSRKDSPVTELFPRR